MIPDPKADDFASVAAAELQAFERQIDAAIASGGQLLTTLSVGRVGANLSAAVGQKGAEGVGAALQGLVSVRGHVVDAHRSLERAARTMGMDWTLLAPGETKPDTTVPDSPKRLRLDA